MALNVEVARHATSSLFGAFSLAFGLYFIVLAVERALIGIPLTIGAFEVTWPTSLGVSIAIGLGGASVSLVVACFSANPSVWVSFAFFMPLLSAQDARRYWHFSEGAPRRAASLDGVWLFLQVTLFAAIEFAHVDVAVWQLTTAWGVAGSASVVTALRLPVWSGVGRYLLSSWARTKYLVGEAAVNFGLLQVAYLVVAANAGLSALGVIRAAQTLLGVGSTAVAGVGPVTMRALARSQTELARRRTLLSYSAFGVLLTGASSLVYFLPYRIGLTLIGPSWYGAKRVIVPLSIAAAVYVLISAHVIDLTSRVLVRRAFVVRLLFAVCLVSLLALPNASSEIGVSYTWLAASIIGVMLGQALRWVWLNSKGRHRYQAS